MCCDENEDTPEIIFSGQVRKELIDRGLVWARLTAFAFLIGRKGNIVVMKTEFHAFADVPGLQVLVNHTGTASVIVKFFTEVEVEDGNAVICLPMVCGGFRHARNV